MGHLEHAKPKEIGIDADRLETAYRLLRKWTTGPKAPIPGGAILVGRHGRVVPPRFFGRQGPEPGAEPIRQDGLFLLASISKPITYLAGMLQVEQGRLNLSDPVTRYIPDFAAQHKEDTLVEHLFTHTSGMPDMLPDNDRGDPTVRPRNRSQVPEHGDAGHRRIGAETGRTADPRGPAT